VNSFHSDCPNAELHPKSLILVVFEMIPVPTICSGVYTERPGTRTGTLLLHLFSVRTELDPGCCHEHYSAQGCLLMTNLTLTRVVTVISSYIKPHVLTSKSRVGY